MGVGRLIVRVREEGTRRLVEGATVHVRDASGAMRSCITDDSGTATLDGLPVGRGCLAVGAERCLPSPVHACEVAVDAVAPVHVELQPAVAVIGFVVCAETGRPVEGARVAALRGASVHRAPDAYHEVTTDAEGRFETVAARAKEAHDRTVLEIARDGFASVDLVVHPSPTDVRPHPMRVALQPGAAVRGVVLDALGNPAANAVVEAFEGRLSAGRLRLSGGATLRLHGSGATEVIRPRSAVTGADGTFRLTGLARDTEFTIVAKRKGAAPSSPLVVLPAPSEPVPEIELKLGGAGAVRIRVTDESGSPATDATVSLSTRTRVVDAVPDGPGAWRADGLDAATVLIFAKAPGHSPVVRNVRVRPGRTAAVCIRLRRSASVAGTVVDDTGAPVPRAEVWVNQFDADDDYPSDEAVAADDRGAFVLADVPRRKVRIVARTPRHERAVVRDVRPPATDVRILLRRAVTVRLQFAFPPGATAADSVHFVHQPLTLRGGTLDPWHGPARTGTVVLVDGRAEIEGVPSRRALLELLVPGWQRVRREILSPCGETVDLGTIQLRAALELAGRVVDERGVPWAGVAVAVARGDAYDAPEVWHERDVTDARGAFLLRGLDEGTCRIHVGTVGSEEPAIETTLPRSEPLVVTIPGEVGPRRIEAWA